MKKIYSILFATVLTAGFSSCEMKDELWGHDTNPADQGNLQMTLSNNANVTDMSTKAIKRDEAVENGPKVHVFDPEEVNVANYTLEITETTNNTVVSSGNVSDLGGNNGTLLMTMEKGKYTAKAYNYDGANVNVSTRPYFAGTASFEILPGNTTNTTISCSLQCIEVAVSLSQSFKDAFYQDGDKGYEITIDNGDGAIQTLTSENIETKYYFKAPESKSSMTVSVKATTKPQGLITEQLITRTYTVTKPAGADGSSYLAGGDAFVINLKEENSTAAYIDFGMTVDFSFADQVETILLPAENVTYNPGTPVEPDTPENPDKSVVVTFRRTPAEYTFPGDESEIVDIKVTAPKGIEKLEVTVVPGCDDFKNALTIVGFPETFDLANPGELESLFTEMGLITEPVKGQTECVVDVTSFMELLQGFPGIHTFQVYIEDAEGNNDSGEVVVTVNN